MVNFFIIGAPKCGTTSLSSWLSGHPDVFFAPNKEVNFWNTDHRLPGRLPLGEYESLFSPAKAVGEGSVWYLYSREAVPRILDYNPDAKFIVCLRDPAEMAISLHHQQVFNGNENIEDFRRAWSFETLRKQGASVRASEPSHLYYSEICRLGEQVERLLSHTDNVHFVHLDDMKSCPQAVYNSVLDFLDLPRHDVPLTPHNPASGRRSAGVRSAVRVLGAAKQRLGLRKGFGFLRAIDRLNARPETWSADPSTMQWLREYYREDSELLSRLITPSTPRLRASS